MFELRYAGFWRAAGCVLALVVLVSALLPSTTVWPASVSDKLLHAVAFLALMIWFSGAYASRYYVVLILALLAFGGLIEAAQFLAGHRTADVYDWLADAAGVAAGYALAVAGLGRWCHWAEALWLRRSNG